MDKVGVGVGVGVGLRVRVSWCIDSCDGYNRIRSRSGIKCKGKLVHRMV